MLNRHAFRLIRQSILIFSIATTGCAAAMNDDIAADFNPQQTLDAAKNTLGRTITPGIALNDAVKALQANHFSCQDTQATSAGATRRSMLCTLVPAPDSGSIPPITAAPAPVRWFITLDSNDGAVLDRMDIQRDPRDIGG